MLLCIFGGGGGVIKIFVQFLNKLCRLRCRTIFASGYFLNASYCFRGPVLVELYIILENFLNFLGL